MKKTASGYIIFKPTEEACRVIAANKKGLLNRCMPPEVVRRDAVAAAVKAGLTNPDHFTLLGFYPMQIVKYRGQTFHWLMENDMDYVAYLVNQVERETAGSFIISISNHKQKLKVTAFTFVYKIMLFLSNNVYNRNFQMQHPHTFSCRNM